jgi:hypothetical protein
MTPYLLEANGLCNPFTNKKKWRITCGHCRHTWDEKVPVVERCSAICPCCAKQNTWSATRWMEQYKLATHEWELGERFTFKGVERTVVAVHQGRPVFDIPIL